MQHTVSCRISFVEHMGLCKANTCLKYTIRCIICHTQHVLCIKTCTPVGTLREVAPTVVAAMHAEYVFLRMSGSTIMCKTQYLVNIERRLAARSGAQVKRHKTNQNQRGAVYAAAIELPLALLSMWRRSLGDRSAIQGQRWLRQLASLHFQNRHLWTDLAP